MTGQLSDTGGVPWSGRTLSPSPFSTDEGRSDPRLVRSLAQVGSADPSQRARAEAEMMGILASSRVVLPLLALPDAGNGTDLGEMATALLVAPDGSKALPFFTGVEALARWDARARPVPMMAGQAAQAALAEEGCHAAVVDVADQHATVVRMSQLWALALREVWVPTDRDPVVCEAVRAAAEGVQGVRAASVVVGWVGLPGVLRVEVEVLPGLGGEALDEALLAVGENLSAEPDVRRRIDDLSVKVVPAAG
ncbi:SseB protein N-terminal domain-containing protein [Austwickia chelonae]|nr:SseB protein N-terminal domain-containing protein [Austwickia chelonae]